MKVTHYINYLFLLAGVLLLNACQEDNFNEPNGIKISFQAVTDLSSSADTIILEEAFIGVKAIDLKRAGEADSAVVEKIVYNGPYVVDLLNGTVSPAIRWIFAEPGYYREIEVTTYSALLQGKSIILRGTVFPAEGEEKIPFEFFSSRSHILSVKNNTGITIREGENLDLLVVFDLSDLLRGIDLNEIEKNEQGVVVISEDDGTGAAASLINTFEAFSSFGIDDGLPFPEREDKYPDNELPDEVETPEENNNDGDDTSENGSDDEGEDNYSGDESGDSDHDDDGAADEDENEDSSDDEGDAGSGNNNDNNSGNGNGGTSSDDSEDTSGNDDDENSGSVIDDNGSDNESGNDGDEQDSGTGTRDEDNAANDEGDDDDDRDDDNTNENDDDRDDDDREDDDESDDDNREDDDNPDDDERDDDDDDDDKNEKDDEEEDDDDKKKDESDNGKGNKGKSDRGK